MRAPFAWHPLRPVAPRPRPAKAKTADAVGVGFLSLGLLGALAGLSDGPLGLVPIALSVILFGLPHGAVDHLVALGLAGRPLRPAPLAAVVLIYLGVALGMFAIWWQLPFVAATLFLAMTVYHWGKADLAFGRWRGDDPPKGFAAGLHLLVRGLIPIGIPFIAFPAESRAFLEACADLFPGEPRPPAPKAVSTFTVLFLLLWLAEAGRLLRHFNRSRAFHTLRPIGEQLLLTAFFFYVPPLTAIGLYFCGWHGLRHLMRLGAYRDEDKEVAVSLPRVMLQSVPFTLAALALLIGLVCLVPVGTDGIGWTATYFVLISSLTVPASGRRRMMDRRELGL